MRCESFAMRQFHDATVSRLALSRLALSRLALSRLALSRLALSRLSNSSPLHPPTCDVSTFPATTAAGYSGASIDLSGIRISIARRQPSFMGMSESTSVRKTYITAARHTALGALKLERDWGLVPGPQEER